MALNTFDYSKETAVNIVKKILTDAIKYKATDIHLDPVSDGLLMKMRIDGELIDYTKAPESMKKNIITRVKILGGMNITDSDMPQKGAINFEEKDVTYNMRVSSLPVITGEKIVIHLSDYTKSLEGLENLGINEVDLNKIKTLMTNSSGIILITGQVLSGKTTTLYSILKELIDDTKNIMTIENPIKMKIDGINQAQVNIDKNLTIPVLLENTLLQDPNIIGLSEIDNDETARLVVRAALNGKLMLSTINTKNIYTTLENLENRDIENYLLATSLSGIISQRLVKRLCPYCKKEREATEYEKNIFKKALNVDIETIIDAVGCRECQDGYTGRIPVTEVLIVDDKIKNAINKKITKEPLRNMIYQNITNIVEDGLNKVLAQETTLKEVLKITDLSNDFGQYNNLLKKAILGEIEINNDYVEEQPIVEQPPVEENIEEATNVEINDEAKDENEEVQSVDEIENNEIDYSNEPINDDENESENTDELVNDNNSTQEKMETDTTNNEEINAESEEQEVIEENNETQEDDLNDESPSTSLDEQAQNEENIDNAEVIVDQPEEELVEENQPQVVDEEKAVTEEEPTLEPEPEIPEENYDDMDYDDYQAI